MRLIILAAALIAAGCGGRVEYHQPDRYTLICHDEQNRVTFRQDAGWLAYRDGAWQIDGYGGIQYKPSIYESCRSEYKQ